ncbi:MAG: NIPSNAP family protein [Burkholderiales bacterium]
MTPIPPIVELRQYTLHPGQFDVLIELFERELIEPHEALGVHVVGIFRDLDAPDRFVWLRGFDDMASRPAALAAFYDGPAWQRHRTAANATMIDSDDVLLLNPATPHAQAGAAGLVSITICPLRASAGDLLDGFERELRASWVVAGASWVIGFVTDPTPNNYPRLPVREGESVIVWLSGFADAAAQSRHADHLAASPEWRAWCAQLAAAPQTLRLAPTARSSIAPEFIGRPHDFDFLVGRWHVRNRRLKQRHVGSDDWDEFPGIEQAWSHLGGIVSVDQIEFPTRGFSGGTVRTLDLSTQRWSIYWINSRTGRLEPPVQGGFSGDRGEFSGDDDDEGRPVKVRFLWERLGPDAARWSQAFSLDGHVWETNWIMEMQRAD